MEPNTLSTIFICGITCSGKTTLSRFLADTLRCDVVFIGDILRAEYSPQQILTGGVHSEEFFPFIQRKVDERSTNLVILDNFPNNLEQYNLWCQYYPTPIITLHIQSQNILTRKISRGRPDDNQDETISRYMKFVNFTVPVMDLPKKHSNFVEINGDQPPRRLLHESINIIRQVLISKSIPFHDFSIPVTFERLSESAKPLIKKEPLENGYTVYLPESIKLEPFQTRVHSTSFTIGVGARSSGLLTGALASKGVLVHPEFIQLGTSELKITFSNLTPSSISILNEEPVAKIIILPTFQPRFIEATTLKYGL